MSSIIALTGLNAATSDLGVIANNVANANTIGFKGSRAEFADLFYGANGIGHGTQLAAVAQQFQQGVINQTGNPLDMAISGEGFFRLSDNGRIVYSRAGAFGVDREGNIVNNLGQRLTGYQVDEANNLTNTIGELRINNAEMEPRATSQVDIGVNLDAAAEAVDTAAVPFDPNNPASYNYSTSLTVYDSQGNSHTLAAYFVRPDAEANDWEVHFTLDGGIPLDDSTDPPTPTVYGPETLSFDENGVMMDGSGLFNLTGIDPGNGAADMEFALDFTASTQFGSPFSAASLVQDGYASGSFAGVRVGEEGILFGQYSNGQSLALGRVALANFQNPQGLVPIGDSNWIESAASGPALVGAPGSGRLGDIRPGALENSNIDLTAELVHMIAAQRNFQANAQVMNTADSMTQTIVNLR